MKYEYSLLLNGKVIDTTELDEKNAALAFEIFSEDASTLYDIEQSETVSIELNI